MALIKLIVALIELIILNCAQNCIVLIQSMCLISMRGEDLSTTDRLHLNPCYLQLHMKNCFSLSVSNGSVDY